jgi:NADH-quinone oxidoreductase subunit M
MRFLVVMAVLGAGVAAAYSLRVLKLIWSGDRTSPAHADAGGGEWSVLAVLVAAVLVLGVAPGLLLNSTFKEAAAITMQVPR